MRDRDGDGKIERLRYGRRKRRERRLFLLAVFQGMVEDILYQRGPEALETCQRQDGTVPVVSIIYLFIESL